MTITATAPTTTVLAGDDVAGEVKLPDLVAALNAVLPHSAEEKVMLPAITGVKVEDSTLDDGSRGLVFAATDRYTLGTYTIPWEGGIGVNAFLPLASAKALLAYAKGTPATQRNLPIGLTFTEHTVDAYDFTRRSSLPLADPSSFPRWRKILPESGIVPDGVQYVGINPLYLARYAKAAAKGDVMRLLFGGTPYAAVRVEIGEHFVGLIMPVRMERPEFRAA